MNSLGGNSPVSPKPNMQYEEFSKAKSIGWFSGGEKSRISLRNIDNQIVKIAAVKIIDPAKQPVTTTFGFKTHERVKIGEDIYDINISSFSKRMSTTIDKIKNSIEQKPNLTEFFTEFRNNYTELEESLNQTFQPQNVFKGTRGQVKQVMEFLSENRKRLADLSRKGLTQEFTIDDFKVTVSKDSLKVVKINSSQVIYLDPLNSLKKILVTQSLPEKLKTAENKYEQLIYLIGPTPNDQCFEKVFDLLKPLSSDEKDEFLKLVNKTFGKELFVAFAQFCAKKEIPQESVSSILRGNNSLTIKTYLSILEKDLGQQFDSAIENFLRKNSLLTEFENNLTVKEEKREFEDSFKFAALNEIPEFFKSIGQIIEAIPDSSKTLHQTIRDEIVKLFKSKGISIDQSFERANNFIITILFLRVIIPKFIKQNSQKNVAVMQMMRNMANQITKVEKINEYSFFAQAILSMQKEGFFVDFAKKLLSSYDFTDINLD